MGILQTLQHIKRRRQIVRVLVTNGFGYMIERMGLVNFTPVTSRRDVIGYQRESDHLLAVRLRHALEELGPTFIKLGQLLSTRPDLLPPVYIEELENLQDKVEPMPYNDLIKQIVNELGHPQDIFAEFQQEPLAAASIGQVHLARLKTGEQVIVKIQRPNIRRTVKNDLEIIIGLASIAENRSQVARRIGMVGMLEEYARTLLQSLDYAREARNTERIYHSFCKDSRVLIPKVYREFCTDRVLTEGYIQGIKLSDIQEITKNGWDRKKLSQLGTEAFLSQVMVYGFFQADPHPGNILIVDENHIAFIDFGEVGSLSGDRLIYIGELLFSMSMHDMDKALITLDDMGITSDLVNRENFQEDFSNLVETVSSGNIGKLDINRLRQEIMALAFQYQLKIPAYLTSLMKAFITVEGVGKKLDPSFDFMEVAKPLANQVYHDRLKPENVYKFVRRKYYRDIRPLGALPGNLNNLLKNTGEGRMVMNIQMGFNDKTSRKLTQLVNRLSSSLIVTGALVGSSLIISANHPAISEKFSSLGVAGFVIALFLLLIYFLLSLKS